jgi:hypothetical protein
MSEKAITISLKNLLKGHSKVDQKAIAQSNQRIKKVMKSTVQDFQKKQRASMEKASRIVLNA